jgi:hypothetical protein
MIGQFAFINFFRTKLQKQLASFAKPDQTHVWASSYDRELTGLTYDPRWDDFARIRDLLSTDACSRQQFVPSFSVLHPVDDDPGCAGAYQTASACLP